ncbi:MAG: hypothetical protein A2X18_05190 [Bacteroidetes bacterium GWF2_40_14]|nr:MAG: hypothetical protein A2X18_05190 [Bacteroidetes bacterium GWF2_40_14]
MRAINLLFVAVIIVIISTLAACGNRSKSFELTGTLEGITDGKIVLASIGSGGYSRDTAIIENGKFVFTGNIPVPAQQYMEIEGKQGTLNCQLFFYAENAKMTLTGHADTLGKALVTGGKTQDFYLAVKKQIADLSTEYNIAPLKKELYSRKNADGPISKVREAELNDIITKFNEESEQIYLDFIKKNPKVYYSAVLVNQISKGKKAEDIEQYLSLLGSNLDTLRGITALREKVAEMKKTEVKLDSFITEAHDLAYKVDGDFAGKEHNDIIYLSILSNDNICALKSNGIIKIIDPNGNLVKELKSNISSKPSAIAVDEKTDNIFVLGTIYEQKSVVLRGKTYQVNMPAGVECLVFNTKGKKLREFRLKDLTTATGARVSDNNLLVADTRGRLIGIFNSENGEKKTSIENLRTCCGILDFSIRYNEILVANLGAFRVNGFDYAGKPTISFGQRGNGIDDFHGCCNPVSVAFLSNGGIVTVEKDPTRIKVYSKEGAKKVEGIEELVKGCAYIPMAVDTKDNVYLASKTGGLVKCIPTK